LKHKLLNTSRKQIDRERNPFVLRNQLWSIEPRG
jgi:hypothetical protein